MITIIASFHVKPECCEQFRALAKDCVEGSRKEEGNISYKLFVCNSDSCRYTFIEEWKDADAIKTHNASAHFLKFHNGFSSFISEKPSVTQNTEV